MRGWPLVFVIAALFNLAVGLVFLVAPDVVHAAIGLPGAPAMATRALGWCVLIFGLSYVMIAAAPGRNRDLARLGVVGKSGIFVLVAAHAVAGLAPASIVALGAGDLLWVGVFTLFLVRTRGGAAA